MKKFNCIKSTTQFFVSTVIGVNISERKSGTERTKKRELVFLFHLEGVQRYCSTSSRRYTDFARATITQDIFNQTGQNTHIFFYNFAERISFAEHWKLVAESSEFHLTLSSGIECIFSNSKYPTKKRAILSEKRESGMVLKSVS